MKYVEIQKKRSKEEIFNHLGYGGIIQNHTKWVWYDQVTKKLASHRGEVDEDMNDNL